MLDIFKVGLILALVRGIFRQQSEFIYEWRNTMATLNEQLTEVNTKLDEAATEIPALIQELRDQIGTVSPEAQAILNSISAKASALADVKPNVPEPGDDEDQGFEPTSG